VRREHVTTQENMVCRTNSMELTHFHEIRDIILTHVSSSKLTFTTAFKTELAKRNMQLNQIANRHSFCYPPFQSVNSAIHST